MSDKEIALCDHQQAAYDLKTAIEEYCAAVANNAPQKAQTVALNRLSNAYLTLVESVKFLEPYVKDQEDRTTVRVSNYGGYGDWSVVGQPLVRGNWYLVNGYVNVMKYHTKDQFYTTASVEYRDAVRRAVEGVFKEPYIAWEEV